MEEIPDGNWVGVHGFVVILVIETC
jgi:hypothetical protein